jgi:hypothetical protein
MKNAITVVLTAGFLMLVNFNGLGDDKTAPDLKKLNITKDFYQTALKYDKEGKYTVAAACLEKAMEERESEDDSNRACFMLANYYSTSRKGIAEDRIKERKYYRQAMAAFMPKAEADDAEAQYIVGICYKNGTGKKELGVEWLLKSANNGYVDAQTALSLCLFKGTGVKRDPKAAMDWLKKAVAAGDMEAKAYLASYYLSRKENLAEGIRLAEEASDAGNAAGQFTLGMAYHTGRGVPKNPEKAMELVQLAADQGQEGAVIILKRLKKQLK